jgi:hypothetical protein
MPSYCSNCGKEIPDSSEKCPKCGAEFEREEVIKTAEECSPDDACSNKFGDAHFKKSLASIAAALLFALFGAILTVSATENILNPPGPDPDAFINLTKLGVLLNEILLVLGIFELFIGVLIWRTRMIGSVIGAVFSGVVLMLFMILLLADGTFEGLFAPAYVLSKLACVLLTLTGLWIEGKNNTSGLN